MGIYDVFISYRRGEGENSGTAIAQALYRYLTERGLRVFFDVEKMKDGHYFWPQIEEGIKVAPNYVLIGTTEAFRFREVDEENEQKDYVKEEITLALSEYEKSAEERTVTVLVAPDAEIPEINDMPKAQRRITLAQRIIPEYGKAVAAVFPKVFNAVTQISRRNLWNAAQRWYENSCSADGRFSSLSIDETIMPFTSENRPHSDLPIRVSSEERNNAPKPLLEALNSTEGHLYLIGQGGIGKTTALMHIMKQAYEKKEYATNAQIPIFVELSYAPDSASGQIYANGKSTFIRRAIFRQVRAERAFRIFGDSEIETLTDLFGLPYDLAVRPIVDLLRQESPAPEYLLLLDGLNEVSTQTIETTLDDGGKTKATVYDMIRGEILWLIENCPNVRIVLTSRSDESKIYADITKLYLSGIDETAVLEYLRNTGTDGKKIRDAEIERIRNNAELMRVLRVPLFLTMYATLRDKNEATAAGEILRVFFNERRRGLSDHTVKDHLTRIEKNVISDSAGFLEGRITADMYDFVLDFILPEIAWRLERKGEFLFSAREIRDIIMPILKDRDDLAICGDFGQEAFTAFCTSDPEDNTSSTAEKMLALANDESKVNRMILGICVNVLGILHFTDSKYGFVHQHIRDYFAAVKNVNTMRLAVYMFEEGEKELALECMNRVFKDEPVSLSVRRFVGEYLGEHKNKPYFANGKWHYGVPDEKCDRCLLSNSLNIYRNICVDEDDKTVFSIISILKETRYDLTGEKLSGLNLKNIDLTKHVVGRNSINTDLTNSILSKYTLFGFSFLSPIREVFLSPDAKALIVFDERDFIYQIELSTMCLVNRLSLPFHGATIKRDESGDFIVISSWDERENANLYFNNMRLITYNRSELKNTISENSKRILDQNAECFQRKENNNYIALYLLLTDYHFNDINDFNRRVDNLLNGTSDYVIVVFNLEDGKQIMTIDNAKDVVFSSSGYLIAYSDNTVWIYDLKQCGKELCCFEYDEIICEVTCSDHYLFVYLDKTFYAYDLNCQALTFKLNNLKEGYGHTVLSSEHYLLIQSYIVNLNNYTFFEINLGSNVSEYKFERSIKNWLVFSSEKAKNRYVVYNINNNQAVNVSFPKYLYDSIEIIDCDNSLYYCYSSDEEVIKKYDLHDFKLIGELTLNAGLSFIKKISHDYMVVVYKDNSIDIVNNKDFLTHYQLRFYSQKNDLKATVDTLDEECIACLTENGYVEIRDFLSLDLKGAIILDEHILAVIFLKKNRQIIVSTDNCEMKIYDLNNLQERHSFAANCIIKKIIVSSNEEFLILIGDSVVVAWDIETKAVVNCFFNNEIDNDYIFRTACLSSDNCFLYLVLESKKLDSGGSSLSVHSGKIAKICLETHDIIISEKYPLTVVDCVLSRKEDFLAIVLLDGTVYVIDSNNLAKKKRLSAGGGISGLNRNQYIYLIDDKATVFEGERLIVPDFDKDDVFKVCDTRFIQSSTGLMLKIGETFMDLIKHELRISKLYGKLNNCYVNVKISKKGFQNSLSDEDIALLQQYGMLID